MSITINNNSIIQSNLSYTQKVSSKYKENSSIQDKKKVTNNASDKVNEIRNTRPQELKSFLNKSELRVLNEVFGEPKRNKLLPKFNTSNNVSLLKGSKIDIEL